MTVVTLYPQRKRCKRCRKFFGSLVVDRLYDSYECAGIKPPDRDPTRWPRQHAFRLRGQIEEKRAFSWPDDPFALELLRNPHLSIYQCTYCLQYHVGHLRPLPKGVQ